MMDAFAKNEVGLLTYNLFFEQKALTIKTHYCIIIL